MLVVKVFICSHASCINRTYNSMLLKIATLLCLSITGCLFTVGCSTGAWSSVKWLNFTGKQASSTNVSGTVAEATATADAVDRIAEIDRREAATRATLEAKYDVLRAELEKLYKQREKSDSENFDKVSEINYGIMVSTEAFFTAGLNDGKRHVLIANLKSKENAARLMPVTEDRKRQIEEEINVDLLNAEKPLREKYDGLIKIGVEKAKEFADLSAVLSKKEVEKTKLRSNNALALAKIYADDEVLRKRIVTDSNAAVDIAKEKQRLEMVGRIVMTLSIVGGLLLIAGFLLKSPTLLISAVASLGLAYTAATIPFWVIPTFIGVLIVLMLVINPVTGKLHLSLPQRASSTKKLADL